MTPCLSLDDVAQINRERIAEMEKKARELDPTLEESNAIFAAQVRTIETCLKYSWFAFVTLARRMADPEGQCELWKRASEVCDEIIKAMQAVKRQFPHCGTPELYDLALDYKNAALERYELNVETLRWKDRPMPPQLFPAQS